MNARSAHVLVALGALAALGVADAAGQVANTRAARILGMFDINGRGGPDQSPDSDGDGLPDSWEVGGLDPEGTDVPFPAADAIVPGSPPQSIFSRRPVRTSATSFDTDGDGLSDFIEVFGLKFIDDNGNGILDDASVRDAAGNILFNADGSPVRATDGAGNPIGEWFDFNQDGMPSIGEFPATNILVPGCEDCFDFDGFVFTDPTNPDTDGDGIIDSADNDPLINPSSFGDPRTVLLDIAFFPCGDAGALLQDRDCDNDGLGNGMDLGNDVNGLIDNPSDLQRVLEVFRRDLLERGGQVRVPEGLIEELLGVDWNGDGLFRLTDLSDPVFGLVATPNLTAANINLFAIEDPDDPDQTIALGHALTQFPAAFNRNTYYRLDERGEGGVNVPLPFQQLLRPAARDDNVFLPDPRIWTVLYAWRFPGFDIDGNGFIGFDGASFRGEIAVNGEAISADAQNAPTSEHQVAGATGGGGGVNRLDGAIDANLSGLCPVLAIAMFGLTAAGLIRYRSRR